MSTSTTYTAAVEAANRALEAARLAVERHPDPGEAPTMNRQRELAESLRVAKCRHGDLWSVRSMIESTVARLDQLLANRAALRGAIATLRKQAREAQAAFQAAQEANPHHEPSWTREQRKAAYMERAVEAAVSGWGGIEWGYRPPAELVAALPPGYGAEGLRHLAALDAQVAENEKRLAEWLAKLPAEAIAA